ncbi:unnamed protein product [Rotaria socialis]|uniref:Aquaporin n=1 Tax=Rotaria socialis TaxID=392032 RepID=A0A820DG36_9BILA|nr:unnamed protein product [Rotaria socialis]CAF4231351.1 unnamed protein product [Rotaria socialis]
MTEDFIPSPSIDSYTMPMEVQIPLLDSSLPVKDTTHHIPRKSFNDHHNKTNSTSIVEKIPHSYKPVSDEDINQSLSNEPKIPKMSDKLIAISQLKTLAFYQALFSEFIGTMLLVLINASAGLNFASTPASALQGALTSGFTVATIIVGFGHTSGAHVNPAVTVTFLAACEIDILRALCYIGMQLLGASFGAFLLKSITPHGHASLGMTMIAEGITIPQACLVEFIVTFVLCYTVHAICDKRRDDIGGSKALAVGLSVVIGCLFGGPYTGASMNPARAFGPAWAMDSWENHWVYWFGPLTGSIAAAVVYSYILKHHNYAETE